MRTYYGSDKKRREDAKRRHREEKRLKRLNKAKPESGSAVTGPEGQPVKTGASTEGNNAG